MKSVSKLIFIFQIFIRLIFARFVSFCSFSPPICFSYQLLDRKPRKPPTKGSATARKSSTVASFRSVLKTKPRTCNVIVILYCEKCSSHMQWHARSKISLQFLSANSDGGATIETVNEFKILRAWQSQKKIAPSFIPDLCNIFSYYIIKHYFQESNFLTNNNQYIFTGKFFSI